MKNFEVENKALQSQFIHAWSLVHGGEYQIRPINPHDRIAVLDLFDHLSLKSRYFRYAHAMANLPNDLLDQIIHATEIDDFAVVHHFTEQIRLFTALFLFPVLLDASFPL